MKFNAPKRSTEGIFALAAFLIFLAAGPGAARAATKTQYAGWLPFWEEQKGALNTALNLEKLSEVSPFSYEINAKGGIVDKIGIHESLWPSWLSAVHDMGLKITPTIAWFDGPGIQALLSNGAKRRAQEDAIAKLVKDERFDGIDIDYEAKLADTIDYFSTFLYGLALRLHPKGKILSCTIESRTPLSALYPNGVPAGEDLRRANDYVALNKYCDEVRIMAYDQGRVDRQLNASKGNGHIYAPVADPDWVEKVIQEATKTISPKKIMLGIPTYGYEWEVTWANGLTTYRRLRSVNYFTAMNVADRVGVVPQRNSAGEMSFTYTSSTLIEVSPGLRWDVSSTFPAELPSWAINSTSSGVVRYLSFPDASSTATEIALVKKYGLRGAVFFKLDGGFDPLLWGTLK